MLKILGLDVMVNITLGLKKKSKIGRVNRVRVQFNFNIRK